MTTTEQPTAGVAQADETAVAGGGTGAPAERGARHEGMLALELAGLAAFAFSRPVLDTFGRSPETFISRGASRWVVVAFGVTVALVPPAAAALLGLATRVLGARARPWAHLVLLGVLGGIGAWRMGRDVTGWQGDATKLVLGAPLAGALVFLARWRLPTARTFLRVAGACSVVFLLQFLALSPASSLVFGQGPTLDDDVVADVAAQLGDDPPDVLYVAFDALPLESLLDGTGHIDAELFPNFAALAGDATWYRNNTSVSAWTLDAVPTLLTGRYPSPSENISSGVSDSENLFTLLGGSYDMQVRESITRLCPDEVCPEAASSGLSHLLGDAVANWWAGAGGDGGQDQFELPGADVRPFEDAARWVSELDARSGRRPKLMFNHMILPHAPWQVTDDGTRYDGGNPATGVYIDGWTTEGLAVGRQRHLLQLQATDRLLGEHLDELRDAGTYDDTLVVVTADHGEAFVPEAPQRGLAVDNYEQIMWTPLLVKEPGQTAGRIDDSDVRSIDVVPTIARALGIDLPWTVDGVAAGEATDRDGDTKPFDDVRNNQLRAEDGEALVEVDARAGFAKVLAADPVEWTGPDAIWKRTAHGDLFRRRVGELDVGGAGDAGIAVSELARLDGIDTGEPLPIEVVARTHVAEGAVVAYALNGTIGAVTEVEAARGLNGRLVPGLLPPDLFVDGENELTAYIVEGPVGREVLHPVEVEGA